MKRSLYIISIIIISTACNKSFLELNPRGTELEDNFYQNETQVFQGLVAAYDVLQWGTSGGYTMKVPLLTTASDEAHAGGSDASDQPSWVAYDNFTLDPFRGPQLGLWQKYYTGVYRANLILEKIELSKDKLESSFVDRVTAEARFLRAYYYFDLLRFFGNIPLITKTLAPSEMYTQEQVAPELVYTQIEEDLKASFNALPSTLAANEMGRVTLGAAKALLGKVLLFKNDNSRMAEAAALLREVNTSPQYGLLDNFEDIFNPENPFHKESVFEIPHSNLSSWGDWGWINGSEGNIAVQFVGPADYNGPIFTNGWGFCPISLDLVNFMQGDPRFEHTIIDGNAMKAQGATYAARYQNTDYFIKKYGPRTAYRATAGNVELNWPINVIDIRLADTYLMEAEAIIRSGGDQNRANDLLNAVRNRVGLGDVVATQQTIMDERRMELATEGHRFFDLVRTGTAAQVLGPLGFQANKHEVLPIPQQEIDITKGMLKQNNY